jgi:hypothetical protein
VHCYERMFAREKVVGVMGIRIVLNSHVGDGFVRMKRIDPWKDEGVA